MDLSIGRPNIKSSVLASLKDRKSKENVKIIKHTDNDWEVEES